MFGRRRWGGHSIRYARACNFSVTRHKHAMRFFTVCVTDVELPEMF